MLDDYSLDNDLISYPLYFFKWIEYTIIGN